MAWPSPLLPPVTRTTFGAKDMLRVGAKKRGKLLASHRSTAYPCFLPDLGDSAGAGRTRLAPAANVVRCAPCNRRHAQSRTSDPSPTSAFVRTQRAQALHFHLQRVRS